MVLVGAGSLVSELLKRVPTLEGRCDPRMAGWRQVCSRLSVCAAVLAIGYAVTLTAVAASLLVEFMTGTGAVGREHLTGAAVRGVLFLSFALLAGAAVLIMGALRLTRRGGARLLVAPLVVLAAVGCVGESVDLVGSASGTSDLVGALIILLALLPVLLVAVDRRRSSLSGAS
jgi:hypothetical protein